MKKLPGVVSCEFWTLVWPTQKCWFGESRSQKYVFVAKYASDVNSSIGEELPVYI